MLLEELYQFAIWLGMENDPRGKETVKRGLEKEKTKYEKLDPEEKAEFDLERLSNPYSDTRILNGNGKETIKSLLVGIDIQTQELLLADRLREKGTRIDAILAHHPEGKSYANFYEVMEMQPDILSTFGVPINISEDLMAERIKEVERKVMPANQQRSVDAARLLGFPWLNVHTPADNQVATWLQSFLDKEKPERLQDLLKVLKTIPEYKQAVEEKNPPRIVVGSPERRVGKILVDMTGGTEGPVELLSNFASAGINTVVSMHLSEKHIEESKKVHLNVVIAGHIPSDTLGMNLFLDALIQKYGQIDIISCSGFRRFSH